MKICPNCQTKYPDDANFCPQEGCATPEGPQPLQAAEGGARFSPLAKIGGESTGEVWRARDNETGAEVAYKVVNAAALAAPAAVARAEREFKQLMRVQSPKVAAIIDCGRTAQDQLYVAMELCEGESLERMLKRGPVGFDKARAIVAQIGQALLEAQKAGIVHRDVAPKNVLVTAAGDVKVINFPIAKPLSDKVSGDPAYVSPEQALGKPVDQRSNTYSLACILCGLLTGEPPFQGATAQAVLDLHVSSPPLPPSQRRPEANLTPEVDRVVLKALDKSSSRRHLTLRLFLSEVESLALPGAPGAATGSAKGEVGFAKTMLFAGGQSEVANLVAKAVAARTGTASAMPAPETVIAAPLAASQPTATTAPPPAEEPVPIAASAAAGSISYHPTVVPSSAASRLTPPPVTPVAADGLGAQMTVAASAPAASAKPADKSKTGSKAAFRETLWFKKGDVDQMVAEAKAKLASQGRPTAEAELPEDARPLEDRYVDDGSVTVEDRKKFSLRTGGTATALPVAKGAMPGRSMSEKDLMGEIGGSRRVMIIVIAAVVVAALVVVVVMMTKGKGPPASGTGAAPTLGTPAVAAPARAPAVAPVVVPTPPPAAAVKKPSDQESSAKKRARKKSRRR